MFVSLPFVLFIIISWLGYLIVPNHFRKAYLALTSMLFCGYLSLGALFALLVSTIIVFVGAKRIAKEERISFVDYNEAIQEMGIDMATDFNDHTHLNFWGSEKFTRYLGNDLRMEE